MGFDIECIIDIHTYPGEYFCPVCRTLVFPNEAVQSQCTHLYCKPCLAHVANGSRACPYDGYLVTEADSKPLVESDKTLAESIGRVKVRCLYHRSGCTWEGPLSDCTSHCSGCSFGNSPVICNRCGVQIVHRQVHEHALSCPGVYPAQQTANDGAQDNPSSGAATTAAGTDSNQTTAHSGTPASQTPNPQTTTASLLPGQDPNQQTNASSQALATASAGVSTSEQWYQQQYQQYYQQYAGYDPYQQYYPYQQQPIQQYQQQPQIYLQPPAQPQTPVLAQPQSQPQPLNPQSQPQAQALPKGQNQPVALAQPHQNQVQVNPQQQLPPAMQPHTQIPSQIYPTSRAHPSTQPPPYPQPYPMQPHSQHHGQVPQYQQPPAQVHPPQSSQAQPHPPVQPQPHSQLQLQINVQHHPQSHGQLRPPQVGQPAHALGQTVHSTANAVSGFHSYPQPQSMQQAPMGMAQQLPMHPHPTSGSMPPVQTHVQVPQQPPLMRPQGLVSNQQPGLVPSQGQAPAQSQLHPTAQQAGHSIQQHPVQPNQQTMSQQYSQPHTFPGQFPGQSHQQGHFTHQQPLQSQFRPQGLPNVVPHSLHAYIQPQQNVTLPPPPQPQQSQTYIGRPGMQNHVQSIISQAHGGYNTTAQVRPVQPALSQPQMNPSYGNHTSNEQESMDQKKRSALESKGDLLPDKTAGRSEVLVPSRDNAQKDPSSLASKSIDAMAPRFEANLDDEQQKRRKAIDEYRQRVSSDIDVHKGDSDELMDKRTVKEEGNENFLKPKSAAKSADATVKPDKDAYNDAPKELDQTLANHASSDAADGSIKDLNPGRNSHDATVDRGGFQQYGHEMPPPKYGPFAQQRPVGPMIIPSMQPAGRASHAQVPGYPPTAMMPSGDVSQAGQPLSSRDHPQFLKQPSSASLGGIPGPGSTTPLARRYGHFPPGEFREGITGMGSAPLSGAEIPSGTQHSVNPAEAEMFQNKMVNRFEGNQPNPFPPGSFEKVPFGQPRSMESARDKRLKAPMGENLSPLPVPHDQASRPLDKPPRGLGYDSGSKFDASAGVPPNRLLPPYHPPGSMHFKDSGEREAPLGPHDDDRKRGGSVFGVHHMDYFSARNPDGEFFNIPPRGFVSHPGFEDIGGREPRQFIEGPGPFNLPSNLAGGYYSDGRFQSGHSHGGKIDGLGDLRGDEHTTFGRPYKHVQSGDLFGKDVPSHLHRVEPLDPQKLPSHLRFGEPAGFGPFAGRAYMGELSGFGDIPGFGESIGRNKPGMPRFGEPDFRSRYPVPGYPNHGLYAGDVDSFDRPRKRKPVSMGWCRICKVDCETVEGLDMHSQTREHQDMAMDMVRSIKEQNRKKQKTFSGRASVEEKGRTRKAVFEGRGRKT